MPMCPFCGSGSAYVGENRKKGGDIGYECLGDCRGYYLTYYIGEEVEDNNKPIINTKGLSPRDKGRLEKCLSRKYAFEDGTMSLGQWLDKHREELTHKSKQERVYSRKKRRGEYEELKRPKVEYTIWTGRTGVDVPKMVWDAIELEERGPLW